jgi:hypothetical protein
MKNVFTSIAIMSLTLSFSLQAETQVIKKYSIEPGFNESISGLLPSSIKCANSLLKSKEFNIRVTKTYGADAKPILAKISKASFDLTFKPFYPRSNATLASTNMVGLIQINNRKDNKTLESLTATVAHETVHNLGYKHSDTIYPDVSYTLGNIVENMATEGACEKSANNDIVFESSVETKPAISPDTRPAPAPKVKKPATRKKRSKRFSFKRIFFKF